MEGPKVLASFKVDEKATIKINYQHKKLFTTIVRNGIEYSHTLLNSHIETLDLKKIQEDPENFCIEEIMRGYCMDAEAARSYFIGEYYYSFGNILG